MYHAFDACGRRYVPRRGVGAGSGPAVTVVLGAAAVQSSRNESKASLKQQFLLTCPTHAIYIYVQIQQ